MATAIHIEVLPARLGDCVLVECRRKEGRPWRLLVDGGPPDTWPVLRARLDRLAPKDRQVDVAVVSHVDSDHIGGIIPMLHSEHARHVGDYWFNGLRHLSGEQRDRSIAQGEDLTKALTGSAAGPRPPWNRAFDGGPVDTGDAGFREVDVEDGPRITVVSPTPERLAALAGQWEDALDRARRRRREVATPEEPGPLEDLQALATQPVERDASKPNGSSIALLVEHRGASVLLAGDAFAGVLEEGLSALAAARGVDAIHLDAFKLPHHGSRANLSERLLGLAPARHYLVSSNGDIFAHPDDAALARVVLQAPRGANVWFNYRNPRTQRWADPALVEEHGYTPQYPREPDTGTVLDLRAR